MRGVQPAGQGDMIIGNRQRRQEILEAPTATQPRFTSKVGASAPSGRNGVNT